MKIKKIELTKANATLAEYVRGASNEPVIVTVDGSPVAALLGIGQLDWELLDVKTLPLFVTTLEAIQEKLKSGEGVSDEEARWGLAVPQYGWTDDPRFASYVQDTDVDTAANEELVTNREPAGVS